MALSATLSIPSRIAARIVVPTGDITNLIRSTYQEDNSYLGRLRRQESIVCGAYITQASDLRRTKDALDALRCIKKSSEN